jgi:hypothetical protein
MPLGSDSRGSDSRDTRVYLEDILEAARKVEMRWRKEGENSAV